MIDGSCVIGASCSFLGGANGTFNIWYVLIFAADVQFRLEVGGNCASGALEFAIAEDVGNFETAIAVYAVNALEGLDERWCLSVLKEFTGEEGDVFGDRHEERDIVHKHNVDAQGNFTVISHDRLW